MQKGFILERKVRDTFNNKQVGQLDMIHKKMIKEMFGNVQEKNIIKSELCEDYCKPDIYIKICDSKKYISIKSGTTNSLHFESIKTFVLFLRALGISKKTQKNILLFHYGDGTLDGTGSKRFLCDDLLKIMKKEIEEINAELNKEWIIRACLERFAFVGIHNIELRVDYIYFIKKTYEIIASRDKLIKYALSKNYDYIKKPHIGPLTFQPYLRDPNRVSKHPQKREFVQIKWNGLKNVVDYVNY